jgi:hypothetical protein
MRRAFALTLLTLLGASTLHADVALVERKALKKQSAKTKNPGHLTNATGSVGLIDNQGLKYFINTDITFSTTSSASAAMSEASYTHAVAASTSAGGTTSSTPNDAFDGYNTLCLSLNNTVANCETGNANFVIYNKNDAAPTGECLGSTSGVNRQLVFPVQTAGNIQMFRKVFVPDNDQFGRWLNYFTNTGGTQQTVTMVIANNLGSDNNTVITATSSGSLTPSTSDTWIASFQNFSGSTTTDVRLGHVLQGAGAAVPLSGLFFQNGNDNPFWGFTFTLNPGETKIFMNFVAGQPSRAAAASKAAQLAALPDNALQCLTTAERGEIANFAAQLPIAEVPTLSRTALGGLVLLLGATAAFRLRRRRAAV